MEDNKYEKGTLGWLREQAKKDGFDNIRRWQRWRTERANRLNRQIKLHGIEKVWTENKIYDLMRQYYEKTGRVPTVTDFDNNPKCPSYNIVCKICGNWNNALEMAGLWDKRVITRKSYADKELLEILKKFETEYGRPATWNDLGNNQKYPSPNTYTEHFGSLENAKKLIGQDLDSIVRKGILETTNQKARLAEIFVLEHFADGIPIDFSGENRDSFIDGVCPNDLIYDVKSSKLYEDKYWTFLLDKGEDVDFYYLLAFNRYWTELLHVWRVRWNFAYVSKLYYIGLNNNYEYNLENTEKYEITVEFIDVFENWMMKQKT